MECVGVSGLAEVNSTRCDIQIEERPDNGDEATEGEERRVERKEVHGIDADEKRKVTTGHLLIIIFV